MDTESFLCGMFVGAIFTAAVVLLGVWAHHMTRDILPKETLGGDVEVDPAKMSEKLEGFQANRGRRDMWGNRM